MVQASGTRKDRICVAVRFRPLSEREYERGDREVWKCEGNAVGIIEDVGMNVKFVYDHVFGGHVSNQQVYKQMASNIVQSSLDGFSGTIFAYGVTSSGKTHTMMGDDHTPGIVPHAIAELFHCIDKMQKKEVIVRLTMMEIYNEVVNDLLNPGNSKLRMLEDNRRGVYMDGITEERLMDADHARHVVAVGNENRKTSATAFNEGSSRSHTIIRITIEANDRPEYAEDPDSRVGRTLSFLNLIDLAGSESAKAEINKNQRREGSFINKSLLTLGTVIHKLSEGNAAHIPFRDSKLTRLLSSSLTGNGARVAVICTITPASTQAEETHNTLKFASRAKKITIEAHRNEIMDQSGLIARYQQEVLLLRRQLEMVIREKGAGGHVIAHDPSNVEVRTLRERLEEEHMAVVEKERERSRLESRVEKLTSLVLHATAAATQLERRLRDPNAAQDAGEPGIIAPPDLDIGIALKDLRTAGDIFPGEAAQSMSTYRRLADVHEVEADLLRKQVYALAEELKERERAFRTYNSNQAQVDQDLEGDVTLQVMMAEREYMKSQFENIDARNVELATGLERMRHMFAKAAGVDPESVDLEGIISGEVTEAGTPNNAALAEAAKPMRRGYDHRLVEKVLKLEEKVTLAIDALQRKEERISRQSEVVRTLTGLEKRVENQVADLIAENDNLKREQERLDNQNKRLLGYEVDNLSNEELAELITNLTQAVDRVRLTVQLRRLSRPERSPMRSTLSLLTEKRENGRMSKEQMAEALEELKRKRQSQTQAIGGGVGGGGGMEKWSNGANGTMAVGNEANSAPLPGFADMALNELSNDI